MEGTFDASNRYRSIVSHFVPSRVFGCSARAVRWIGNGAVEERQNSGAKSKQDVRKRGARVTREFRPSRTP
jgi:hypothetical protein